MTLHYRTILPDDFPGAPPGPLVSVGTLAMAQSNDANLWEFITVSRSGMTVSGTDIDIWKADDLTAVRRRVLSASGSVFAFERDGESIAVTTSVDGEETISRLEFGGPVVSDGLLNRVALGTLPLEIGYTSLYNSYVRREGGIRTHRIEVTDRRMITVPAGTFDTFVVKTRLVDAGAGSATATWYIKSSEPRVAVRMEAELPSSGIATVELLDILSGKR